MNDLDLSGINWDPIGTGGAGDNKYFKGVFDGNGHTIKNLTINRPDEDTVGLFGSISSGAEIKNLGLTDVDVIGNDYVGGLVGFG